MLLTHIWPCALECFKCFMEHLSYWDPTDKVGQSPYCHITDGETRKSVLLQKLLCIHVGDKIWSRNFWVLSPSLMCMPASRACW